MRRLLCIAVTLLGCRSAIDYRCSSDAQCALGSTQGICVEGHCAFPATACDSGYRYDRTAGSFGNECVQLDLSSSSMPDMLASETDLASSDEGSSTDSGGDSGPAVKHMGDHCGATDTCDTGNCVDGYCCNLPCGDQCQACDVTGFEGQCTPVTGQPHSLRTQCGGANNPPCSPRTCDGTNTAACVFPTSRCRDPSCTAGTAILTASCDGAGNCPAVSMLTCAGNICGATACATVTQIAAGGASTCALLTDGSLKCWGANFAGQLGLGDADTTDRHTPTRIASLSGITAVAVGGNHACAILSDNTLTCWGSNSNGQLGRGTKDNNPHGTPQAIGGLANVIGVSLGDTHSCAVIQGGTLKCWGLNTNGQVGDGTSGTDRTSPTAVCALGTSGSGCAAAAGVQQVAAGGYHTCARFAGNAVGCWGLNAAGQLGFTANGNPNPNPTTVSGLTASQIALGSGHSCAIVASADVTLNNTIMCWGNNSKGQLGIGSAPDVSAHPTPASVCISDGCVCAGAGCSAKLQPVTSIALGGSHTCVVSSAYAECWGFNMSGQLGDSSNSDEYYQATSAINGGVASVDVGSSHSCARLTSGLVKCWGADDNGQLGNNDVAAKNAPVTPVW